ncbi:MAG: asparagine synthase-related protein [Nitrososphaerales archaeon]
MLEHKCDDLREALTGSVIRNLSNAVLLSGGLDSSIIASIAAGMTDLHGITVTHDNAPDLKYAKLIAEKHSIKHLVKELTLADMEGATENVVRIMRSFDPMEVRNTLVLYASIEALKQNGFNAVMTGDGGDELFVGYDYLLRLEAKKLEDELKKLWDIMHFSSVAVGKELSVSVKIPFLDQKFVEFAKRIPVAVKVKQQNSVKWGKWILRSCFEDLITKDVAWRIKMPLEQGAGTSAVKEHFSSSINDDDYNDKVRDYASIDSVKIRDKEHLQYYEFYRKFFDAPKESDCDARCPDCQGCVRKDSRFCRTCGAFPIKPV